jgi:hypothetical protein
VIIIAIAFCVVFSSCMTNRKGELTQKGKNFIALHCKGSDSTITKEKTVLKDTTLYITTPGPIQYLPNPCKDLCDSLGNLKPFEKKEKKNGIKSTIKSVGNSIAFDCEADSLKAVITTLQKEISITSKEKTVIQKPCELDHIDRWDSFWIRSGQILIILLILYFMLKFCKGYLHTVAPWTKFIIK